MTKLIGGLLLSLGPTSPPRTRRGTQRGSATVPPYAFEEEEHFPHYMTTNSSPGPQAHAFGESWGLPERIHTSTPRPGNLTLGNVDVSPLTDLSLIGHSLLVPQHPQIVVEGERGSPRETRLGQTEGVSAGYEYPRLPDSTRSSGTEGVIAPTPGTGVVHPSPQTVESPMVPAPPEDFSRTMPLSNSSSSKQTNAASSREAPSHSSGIREPTSGHASPPETTSPIKSERTNTVSQPERQWLYGLPESAHYAATQITYTDAKPDLSVRSRAAVADPDERKKTLSEETQASPGMDNDESYEPDSAPSEYSMHSSAVTERRFAHIHDWQETLAEEQSESSFDRVPIATHIDETRRQNTPVFDPWQMKMYNAWGRPYNTIKMGPRRTFTYMVTDRMPHMAGVTPVPPGSPQPSRAPTAHPSQAPSPQPSRAPSVHPSQAPSQKPKKSAGGSHIPSPQPSRAPSAHPSQAQSQHPRPSRAPSPHDEKASQANFHEAAPDAEASGSDPKQKDKGKSGRFEREDFKIPKSERPRPPPPRKDRGFSAPPPGGLFARRLGKGKKPKQEESSEGEQEAEDDNPSDSSSSDSDESSSSSDSSHPKKGETPEQRAARKEKAKHRRRKRKEVKAIRALRLPMPTYNGTADYDTFEAWMGKWESWCKSNGLKKEARIETMRYALLGKASAWFTRHVALEVKGWTLRAVYRQLYENCFPVSFREDLRNKLMTATQHGRPIKDFAKDLENLGLRYDDIDPLTIRRIFWEGVDDYVKLYWIDKGLSLEYTDIDTLVYYAYRVEKREYERRKMERRRTGRRTGAFSTHTSSFGASRVSSGMTTERPRGNANPGQKPQAAVMSAASRPSTSRKGNDRGRASNEPLAVGVRLSSKQTAEHRAQGLCFHCHEQGHESPACPMKQNTESRATRFAAVAPAISSATGEKRALKPRVKRQLKSLPSAAVRVMFAAPPLQNYVSAAVKLSSTTHLDVSETKLALLNAELLGFFDPSTAMRYHLALPSQRFITATSTHLEAPCVDPDEVAVYDVCNRFEIRVPLADIGTTRLDIGGLWARHLGLGNDELGCVFRAEVPDEESWGVKIRGALTLVNGTWCVARSLNDAAEFGHNPTERFLVQGNGETYVVRDQASGIVFEVFPYDLNFGITLRQVLRRPQVFEFAGELVRGITPPPTRLHADASRRLPRATPQSGSMTAGRGCIQPKRTSATMSASTSGCSTCGPSARAPVRPASAPYSRPWTSTTCPSSAFAPRSCGMPMSTTRSTASACSPTTTACPAARTASTSHSWASRLAQLAAMIPRMTTCPILSLCPTAAVTYRRLPRLWTARTGIWATRSTSAGRSRCGACLQMPGTRPRSSSPVTSLSRSRARPARTPSTILKPSVLPMARAHSAPLTIWMDTSQSSFLAHLAPARLRTWTATTPSRPCSCLLRTRSPCWARPSTTESAPRSSAIGRCTRLSALACCAARVANVSRSSPNGRTSATKSKDVGVGERTIRSITKTSMRVKNDARLFPMPVTVYVRINGRQCTALVDSGSLTDFMSTTLADQLKVRCRPKEQPLDLQLAIVGSRSKVNVECETEFVYQNIREQRKWDVANVDTYDIVLGTPFIWQHSVLIGLNPTRVLVGSDAALPLEGKSMLVLRSAAVQLASASVDKLREIIFRDASDLFKEAANTPIPPLRIINHEIPLKDEQKIYPYRPSRCPEALRPQWVKKKMDYLNSGRWRYSAGGTCCPLLIIPKPKSKDGEVKIRTVIDTRLRNDNTVKVAAPLPDIEEILRNVVKHEYRSLIDGKDAYEQIRIKPEHVNRSMFNTPDGTMESLVMQIGDCNAPATYQTLMNQIFAPYIGVFMEVYLDDIIVYSDTPEEHIEHLRKVFEILRRECFFLNPAKMQLFAEELIILGHVIDRDGIKMDPNKVESVIAWPTPTNKGLLMSFLGAVGFLANDCKGIRIPMGVLTSLVGTTKIFKWTDTHQRALDEVKQIVQTHRDKRRHAIDYTLKAGPVNLVTDASLTGGSGYISQGENLATAHVVTFWSGKFNSAQQNYPVHERELLAIVESLKRFRPLLHGVKFRVCTDHKTLVHFMKQKDLSQRQMRWLQVLNEFDFNIEYIPGIDNVLADSLSRVYSDDQPGTVRAKGEYIDDADLSSADDSDDEPDQVPMSAPVFVGRAVLLSAAVAASRGKSGQEGENSGDEDLEHAPRRSARLRGQTAPVRQEIQLRRLSSKAEKTGRPALRKPRIAIVDSDGNESEESREDASGKQRSRISSEPGPEDQYAGDAEIPQRQVSPSRSGRAHSPEGTRPNGEMSDGPKADADVRDVPDAGINETGMARVISAFDPEIDLRRDVAGRYVQDPFFVKILEQPAAYKNFAVEGEDGEELIFMKSELSKPKLLCIPDIQVAGKRLREVIIDQGHSVLAHLGAHKTMLYLRQDVWWKNMVKDISDFVESCHVCRTTKDNTQKPYGLLRTLPVPTRPWQVIGIDFIGPLPASQARHGRYDRICTIIDLFSSMVHLQPARVNYKAPDMAELLFHAVYRLHGMPEAIVSDRDVLFTSPFWQRLHELTGVKLRMSTAYHPQTDGATERANRSVGQMVRNCISVDQKDWAAKLPAIEFAMNSATSATTGFSPFYLNYGQNPRSVTWDRPSQFPGVQKFAETMREAMLTAHDAIIAARVQQTTQANKHRQLAPFKQGDKVYLSTKNLAIPKGLKRKLVPKYIGPLEILKEIEPGSAYMLKLPPDMARRKIHPTFNADLLRPYIQNDDLRFPGRTWNHVTSIPLEGGTKQIAEIVGFKKSGEDFIFYCKWSDKHITEEGLEKVKGLPALFEYCDIMGFDAQRKFGVQAPDMQAPDVRVASIRIALPNQGDAFSAQQLTRPRSKPDTGSGAAGLTMIWETIKVCRSACDPHRTLHANLSAQHHSKHSAMSFTRPPHFDDFAFVVCSSWANQIRKAMLGAGGFPAHAPPNYGDFHACNPNAVSAVRGDAAIDAEMSRRELEAAAAQRRVEEREAQQQHQRENDRLNIPVAALKLILDHDTDVARLHTTQIEAAARVTQSGRGWFNRRGFRGRGGRPPRSERLNAFRRRTFERGQKENTSAFRAADVQMRDGTPAFGREMSNLVFGSAFAQPSAAAGATTPTLPEYSADDYDYEMENLDDSPASNEQNAGPSETGSVTAGVAGLGIQNDPQIDLSGEDGAVIV